MTARMLVDIKAFPSMKVANRRLNKLARRRGTGIRRIGTAVIDGVLQYVYTSGPRLPASLTQHETEITQLLLGFDTDNYRRHGVPFHADWEMWIGELRYLGENERATNNRAHIYRKCRKLAEADATILWVCADPADMRRKIRWTKLVHDKSLYALFDDVVADAHGPVWRFADGVVTDLPRALERV